MSSIWTIRRSTTDMKLTGLCGGVAQHWGVDPVLVRVGWALLALSGGIGLVLYVAGWLLVPLAGKDRSAVEEMSGGAVSRWPRELWVTLVIVACLVAFAAFGTAAPFSIAPALVIAVIWYFGFYKPRLAKTGGTTNPASDTPAPALVAPAAPQFVRYPGPPTPFTVAAEAWARRIEEARAPVPPVTWPAPPPPGSRSPITEPDPEARDLAAFWAAGDPVGLYADPVPVVPSPVLQPGRRTSARRLRMVSLIITGLALSGLGVADAAGVTVPLAAYFATALLVVGLTLVLATFLGRAGGLLPLGVLLAATVLIVTAAGPTDARMPDLGSTATRSYLTLADLPADGDALDVGRLTVDLSRLSVTEDATYRARVDAGKLQVIVPEDANVVVQYSNDLGAVHVYGSELAGGTELRGEVPDPDPVLPGAHTLTLYVSVDVGNIEVRR